MQKQNNQFKIEKMAKPFGISRSGYYAYVNCPISARQRRDEALLAKGKESHVKSRETYGSTRIYRDLKGQGEAVSRK